MSDGGFPEPAWVRNDEDRHRFRLLIAALYHSRSASLTELATILPITAQALHESCSRDGVRPQHAVTLEKALGEELFPRAFFRPDVFA